MFRLAEKSLFAQADGSYRLETDIPIVFTGDSVEDGMSRFGSAALGTHALYSPKAVSRPIVTWVVVTGPSWSAAISLF